MADGAGSGAVARPDGRFSDLQGDHEQRAFKLPDPMYFIP